MSILGSVRCGITFVSSDVRTCLYTASVNLRDITIIFVLHKCSADNFSY